MNIFNLPQIQNESFRLIENLIIKHLSEIRMILFLIIFVLKMSEVTIDYGIKNK